MFLLSVFLISEIMEKLRVFTAFSGYGSQEMALKRLPIDFEVVGISEIDKYAIQAYMSVHGDTPNFGDITKINWDEVPDFDLFTMSSPCQDFSTAGKRKGGEEGSGTRSSLLWECRRAIIAKKPKYVIFENVKGLNTEEFRPGFLKWQSELASMGYNNFTQILNAKDYGVPQNRERIFMVSILGDNWYNFPKPFPLEKRLKDVLEENISKKYYLSDKAIKYMNELRGEKQRWEYHSNNVLGLASTIPAVAYKGAPYCILSYTRDKNGNIKNYHPNNIANTIHTSTGSGGNTDQFVFSRSHGHFKGAINRKLIPAITTSSWESNHLLVNNTQSLINIRKLTEREVGRLMDVSEDDLDIMLNCGISKTQLYKMFGNSIVVAVLEHIFRNLLCPEQKDINETLFG